MANTVVLFLIMHEPPWCTIKCKKIASTEEKKQTKKKKQNAATLRDDDILCCS